MKILGIDPEEYVPRTQNAFRVDQAAKMFCVSVSHVFNLIIEGEIVVAKERIESSPSRASILIPRESLVNFVGRRINSPPNLVARAASSATPTTQPPPSHECSKPPSDVLA